MRHLRHDGELGQGTREAPGRVFPDSRVISMGISATFARNDDFVVF